MKKIMIDIETNGTDREKMEVLEVGAALIYMNLGTGYYEYSPISPFQFTIHSLSQPQSDFAKKNQVELYKLCNEMSPEANYEACRKALLSWFEGANLVDRWSRNMMGKNVVTFDLDILHEAGILDKEDYHYRVHEQTGGIYTLEGAMGIDRDSVYQAALAVTPTPIPEEIKKMGAHRALYDCYEQVALENGLIRLIRQWRF